MATSDRDVDSEPAPVEMGAPRVYDHPCGYIDRGATTEARIFRSMTSAGYMELLHRGYRRFGDLFFRPRCQGCELCLSLRVCVPQFRLGRRFRRVLARNHDVSARVAPVRADPEAVAIANSFYLHRAPARGWPMLRYDVLTYTEQFCTGPVAASEVRYTVGDTLMAVALFDDLPEGETAVICHYADGFAARSPGTFNVLWLIERARARGMPYAYLGYYVPASQSMRYKALFRPAEVLYRGEWWDLDRLEHTHPELFRSPRSS